MRKTTSQFNSLISLLYSMALSLMSLTMGALIGWGAYFYQRALLKNRHLRAEGCANQRGSISWKEGAKLNLNGIAQNAGVF